MAFAANEEIKWIETAAELEAAFLSSARDTHGRRWADFEDQADAIWYSIAAMVWEVEERPDESSAALDELFRIVRQTEESTLAYLDLAWADAFATGRVLVVEGNDEGWRIRAPDTGDQSRLLPRKLRVKHWRLRRATILRSGSSLPPASLRRIHL